MQKWIVQGLTPILSGLALLLVVIGAGRAARAALHDRAAYRVAFSDIDCQPPQGMSRTVFLSEVQSVACQPAALRLLDEDLSSRLHRAFLSHPWVQSVRSVAINPHKPQGPEFCRALSVHVEIEYRRAVLAVPTTEGGWRMVDRHGILLPNSDVQPHLPVLITAVDTPVASAGSNWGDARISAAAKTAAFLQPSLSRLHLEDCQMEVIEGEILLRRPGIRIVWGHAPGQEKEEEVSAKVKLRRLIEYQTEHDSLESLEHDVRLLAYQGHFPLPADERKHTVTLYAPQQTPSPTSHEQVSNSSRSWRSCFNDAKPAPANPSSR